MHNKPSTKFTVSEDKGAMLATFRKANVDALWALFGNGESCWLLHRVRRETNHRWEACNK